MTPLDQRQHVFRTMIAVSVSVSVSVSVMLLSGCATAGQTPGRDGPAAVEATSLTAADKAAEKVDGEAMDCVTGTWVASTDALQTLFDQAIAESGMSDYRIIAGGSIVYEFLKTGFGVNVIPTEFTMTMPTVVGDVVGEVDGSASALMWGVKGDNLQVAGEDWQNGLTMRWTFSGETIDVDTGAQSMVQGLTDINRFTCTGDELVLKSKSGPPLTLVRMTQIG